MRLVIFVIVLVAAGIVYRLVTPPTCHVTYRQVCDLPLPGEAGMCVEPHVVEIEVCE